MTTLIIIESPSKIKKIEEYLGENFKVMATFGHITELKTLKNINIDDNFSTSYDLIESKKQNINNLRKAIQNARDVLLACDDDREGQAINLSICEVFNLPLTTKRLVYNEITQTALEKAIQNPQPIDFDMVESQRTRQIIDLLVGFTTSPTLWKYISPSSAKSKNPLSAGRCQSVVLRLIYDNEMEIRRNSKTNIMNVYNTTGYFKMSSTGIVIPFDLNTQFENRIDVKH